MTADKHGFPTGPFFVAYHRFKGFSFPKEGTWGDILDAPADDEALIEAIIETYRGEEFAPDRSDLRVFQVEPGKPAEDCTAWAIKTVVDTLADRVDEGWIQ